MWRANTDTPKKRTRQITEESFGTAKMFDEIPSAAGKDTTDPSGLVGDKTVTRLGSGWRSAEPSDDAPTRLQLNVLLYEAFVTFEACGPFGPWVISNST
jgi:hypothetical protein